MGVPPNATGLLRRTLLTAAACRPLLSEEHCHRGPVVSRTRVWMASDRHRALERAFVHGRARAGIDDSAAVHDGEVVAKLERKVEILLDQHGCNLAEVAQIRDGAADVLDDRGLDALGWLVEQQRARPHHQRAADRELLLLAAGEVAAAPAEHAVEHRKEREHIVRDAAVLALERREAGLEIFLDREQRKNLAALRHIGDAAARAVGGLERGDILAVEADAATADRLLAGQCIEQAGLADAVAAEHASYFARFGDERDRAQRLRSAVMQVDGLCLKHRSTPARSDDRSTVRSRESGNPE